MKINEGFPQKSTCKDLVRAPSAAPFDTAVQRLVKQHQYIATEFAKKKHHAQPCESDGECISRDCGPERDGKRTCQGPGGYFDETPKVMEVVSGREFEHGQQRAKRFKESLAPLLLHMEKRGKDKEDTNYTSPGVRVEFSPHGKIDKEKSPLTLTFRYSVTKAGFDSIPSKLFDETKLEDQGLWGNNRKHLLGCGRRGQRPKPTLCAYFYATVDKTDEGTRTATPVAMANSNTMANSNSMEGYSKADGTGTAKMYTGNGLATALSIARFEYAKKQFETPPTFQLTNAAGVPGALAYGHAAINCGYKCYDDYMGTTPDSARVNPPLHKVADLLQREDMKNEDLSFERFVYCDSK